MLWDRYLQHRVDLDLAEEPIMLLITVVNIVWRSLWRLLGAVVWDGYLQHRMDLDLAEEPMMLLINVANIV